MIPSHRHNAQIQHLGLKAKLQEKNDIG